MKARAWLEAGELDRLEEDRLAYEAEAEPDGMDLEGREPDWIRPTGGAAVPGLDDEIPF